MNFKKYQFLLTAVLIFPMLLLAIPKPVLADVIAKPLLQPSYTINKDLLVSPATTSTITPVTDPAATTTTTPTTSDTATDTTPIVTQPKERITTPIKDLIQTKNEPKTASDQKGIQDFLNEYWVQFLALIVSVVGVFLGVTGFSMASKRKQKHLKRFFHEIDTVYASYKWKTKRCEAELYRVQDLLEEKLKEGEIDENAYQLLNGRINQYLEEIKQAGKEGPST